MRRTKIVATLGPASAEEAVLRRLLAAGMDVARLNFSHGTRAWHGRTIRLLRRVAREAGVPLAILQDLQGPKIRVGRLAWPVRLEEGAEVVLTTRRVVGSAARIPIAFPRLGRLLRRGGRILMKDGTIELEVLRAGRAEVACRVVRGGTLGEHQGVNLPGARLRGAPLTPKDLGDLRFGLGRGVDYVALSFVRSAADVRHARRVLRRLGRTVPLVAKLEKAEAVADLDRIVAEADAVMVARGDLGVELPAEQVPLLQKRIIRCANERGIPVITATQMLESMIANPRPTRAEVSDVANAILDGTDAVMLSGETAVGRYPVEAVRVMARIALLTEAKAPITRPALAEAITPEHAISLAARMLCEQTPVKLIVVFTRSGLSARLISRDRPGVPILALTPDDHVRRQLALWWGLMPQQTDLMESTEELIAWADRFVRAQDLAQPGDHIVVMGGMPVARRSVTNFVKLHAVSVG